MAGGSIREIIQASRTEDNVERLDALFMASPSRSSAIVFLRYAMCGLPSNASLRLCAHCVSAFSDLCTEEVIRWAERKPALRAVTGLKAYFTILAIGHRRTSEAFEALLHRSKLVQRAAVACVPEGVESERRMKTFLEWCSSPESLVFDWRQLVTSLNDEKSRNIAEAQRVFQERPEPLFAHDIAHGIMKDPASPEEPPDASLQPVESLSPTDKDLESEAERAEPARKRPDTVSHKAPELRCPVVVEAEELPWYIEPETSYGAAPNAAVPWDVSRLSGLREKGSAPVYPTNDVVYPNHMSGELRHVEDELLFEPPWDINPNSGLGAKGKALPTPTPPPPAWMLVDPNIGLGAKGKPLPTTPTPLPSASMLVDPNVGLGAKGKALPTPTPPPPAWMLVDPNGGLGAKGKALPTPTPPPPASMLVDPNIGLGAKGRPLPTPPTPPPSASMLVDHNVGRSAKGKPLSTPPTPPPPASMLVDPNVGQGAKGKPLPRFPTPPPPARPLVDSTTGRIPRLPGPFTQQQKKPIRPPLYIASTTPQAMYTPPSEVPLVPEVEVLEADEIWVDDEVEWEEDWDWEDDNVWEVDDNDDEMWEYASEDAVEWEFPDIGVDEHVVAS